jgi:hypothetical protein
VTDGGFVDPDSLMAMSETRDEMELQDAIHFSFRNLCLTVHAFLVQKRLISFEEYVTSKYIADYVRDKVCASFESEARPGLRMDPRVEDYFRPASSFEALVGRFDRYYPTEQADLKLILPGTHRP